tara:strand:- start:175 stop:477 length:303 start_codon:yes stop_codon:yes gene_type:complete
LFFNEELENFEKSESVENRECWICTVSAEGLRTWSFEIQLLNRRHLQKLAIATTIAMTKNEQNPSIHYFTHVTSPPPLLVNRLIFLVSLSLPSHKKKKKR